MSKHSRHVNAAMKAAMNSDMHHMHGAVAVKRGKKVAVGYNKCQTRFLKENVPSIHAELDALHSLISRDYKERLLCC